MTILNDETRLAVMIALNCGGSPADVAQEFGLPYRTVHSLSRNQRRFPQPRLPEGTGRVLHHAAAEEKWCQRPARAEDLRRRDAARKAVDDTLAKFGLKRKAKPIIVPDAAFIARRLKKKTP